MHPKSKAVVTWPVLAAVTLASAVMYFFSLGLEGVRFMVWAAPLPLLLIATRCTVRQCALAGFAGYALGGTTMLPYLLRITPLPVALLAILGPSLVFALGLLLFRLWVRVRSPLLATVGFPAVWTVYEFAQASLSPHATWGSLAYTQADFLPVLQLAALTGIWGITFLLVLVPTAVAAAWHFRDEPLRSFAISSGGCGLLVLVGIHGLGRLAVPTSGSVVQVGLAASDSLIMDYRTTEPGRGRTDLQRYLAHAETLALNGAHVVVLPEKCVSLPAADLDTAISMVAQVARSSRTSLIIGLEVLGTPVHRNLALAVSHDGTVRALYDKVRLVPGWESQYTPGTRPAIADIEGVRSGILICKDMDAPAWSRRYEAAGARILFVPAWDFTADAWLHARMAVVRGVEIGAAVVRCAQQGFLTVSDDRGRIVAETASGKVPDVALLAGVGAGGGRTLYALAGDWFAWLNGGFVILAGLVTLLRPVFRKMRGRTAP